MYVYAYLYVYTYVYEHVYVHVYVFQLAIFSFPLRSFSLRMMNKILSPAIKVRICTEQYQPPTASNINNICMHLTNYSVNKASGPLRQRREILRGSEMSALV